MYVWTLIHSFVSEYAFEEHRDQQMCCSTIQHKDDKGVCVVCGGDHVSVERRIRCSSPTCGRARECLVVWKVRHCTATDRWDVLVNDQSHGRGALPCAGEHLPRVTSAMKAFFAKEDEGMVPPRMIETRLRSHETIKMPARGWPTYDQIVNAVKRIRDEKGLRNTIDAIRAFVELRVYKASSEHQPEKAVIFGPRLDANGFPYVAAGTDEDPFVLGVTAPRLIDNVLRFADGTNFSMFHADATFKLSDFAYPVVTCGFTDNARGYQVAALFVVSQRTQREYGLCFRALESLVWDLRGRQLQVSAVMGDADQAQFLGFKAVRSFSEATPLMCYFHVLYNVRKRTAQFPVALRQMVMTDLMDMHFTLSPEEFQQTRDKTLERWSQVRGLGAFTDYFSRQWLSEPFWRWQIYHSPSGYAATNNPCEVYNAAIKKFTQRRRFHMCRLLQKLCELVETERPSAPVSADYAPTPTPDVVAAAKKMIASRRTTLHHVVGETRVYVKYVRSNSEEQASESNAFVAAFDKGIEVPKKVAASKNDGTKADAKKAKGAQLYKQAVSWSLWRAHNNGMPPSGWLVDYQSRTCECRYFAKFCCCAHLLIAENRHNLNALGKPRKILNRARGQRNEPVQLMQQDATIEHENQAVDQALAIWQDEEQLLSYSHDSQLNTSMQHLANTPEPHSGIQFSPLVPGYQRAEQSWQQSWQQQAEQSWQSSWQQQADQSWQQHGQQIWSLQQQPNPVLVLQQQQEAHQLSSFQQQQEAHRFSSIQPQSQEPTLQQPHMVLRTRQRWLTPHRQQGAQQLQPLQQHRVHQIQQTHHSQWDWHGVRERALGNQQRSSVALNAIQPRRGRYPLAASALNFN